MAIVYFLNLGLLVINDIDVEYFFAVQTLFQLFDGVVFFVLGLMYRIVIIEELADDFELLGIDQLNVLIYIIQHLLLLSERHLGDDGKVLVTGQ